MSNDVEVAILADTPAAENQDTIDGMAVLIRAARAGQLVGVVCTHNESGKSGTIICSMQPSSDNPGNAIYAPLALLFTEGSALWLEYTPPRMTTPALGDMEYDSRSITDEAPQKLGGSTNV